MPWSYWIDAGRRLVLSRAWGVLDAAEFFAHAHSLRKEPEFRRDFRQLGDLRGVESVSMTTAELQSFADANPFGPGARRAIVVPSDVAFGLARMYEAFTEPVGQELRVFRDYREALEWLGLVESDVEQLAAQPGRVSAGKEATRRI